MSLFDQIQLSVMQEDTSLSAVLLKLRLLASRLDSDPMEQWVREEMEGYTSDAVPPYRVLSVAYRGTFSGPLGSGFQDVPIPSALVDEVAGNKHWTQYKMTKSISAIDQLARSAQAGGELQIECSNLILLLKGKMYPKYACTDVVGAVSPAQMVNILDVVRSKVLDLTIAMAKADPNVRKVGASDTLEPNQQRTTKVNQVFHQTIHHAKSVTNNTFFYSELEQIIVDRIEKSDTSDPEKAELLKLVESAGIQEVVKQFVQKVPGISKLLLGALLN